METIQNSTPTLTEKESAIKAFKLHIVNSKQLGCIRSWLNYSFGISHDGFTFWNEKSNHIGFDEVDLIQEFCRMHRYTLGFITKKTTDVSGYGGVMCEINICK